VSAFGLYKVKFQVQTIRAQIAEVSQEIVHEREGLNVVAAEWAYLNRPDRLQKLSELYLNQEEVTVNHIADVQMIPFPHVQEAKANTDSSVVPVSEKRSTTLIEAE
jgi:hypothetical protein